MSSVYRKYIDFDPAWQVKRNDFNDYLKMIDNYKCYNCGCSTCGCSFQVHHTTYRFIKEVWTSLEDSHIEDSTPFNFLELLCEYCHAKQHKKIKDDIIDDDTLPLF